MLPTVPICLRTLSPLTASLPSPAYLPQLSRRSTRVSYPAAQNFSFHPVHPLCSDPPSPATFPQRRFVQTSAIIGPWTKTRETSEEEIKVSVKEPALILSSSASANAATGNVLTTPVRAIPWRKFLRLMCCSPSLTACMVGLHACRTLPCTDRSVIEEERSGTAGEKAAAMKT